MGHSAMHGVLRSLRIRAGASPYTLRVVALLRESRGRTTAVWRPPFCCVI